MQSMLMLLVACGGGNVSGHQTNTDPTDTVTDEDAPVIVDEPVSEAVPFGEDVPISATVTDEGTGVLFVFLWYKNETEGDQDWRSLSMLQEGDEYSASIPGDSERSSGMDYYLEAVDKAQNEAYAPSRGGDDPYHFRLYE